jgi:hypothetical protein
MREGSGLGRPHAGVPGRATALALCTEPYGSLTHVSAQHPEGHRYRGTNPFLEELAPAPAWFIELMMPDRGTDFPAAPELVRSRAYGAGALRRELQRLSQAMEGSRNDRLNIASFNMGRLVAAGAIDEQEVAAALIEQGQRIGLGAIECERTVASGPTAGMRRLPALGIDLDRRVDFAAICFGTLLDLIMGEIHI